MPHRPGSLRSHRRAQLHDGVRGVVERACTSSLFQTGFPPHVNRRSLQCLTGWGAYIRIAGPSCAMVCVEWWSVELLILAAGLLPQPSLSVAVTGICLNVMSLVYMMSFGLSGALVCVCVFLIRFGLVPREPWN